MYPNIAHSIFICSRVLALPVVAFAISGQLKADSVPDSLSIKQTARVLWDFESGRDGYTSTNQVSSLAASTGCLRGTSSGADPYIYDPKVQQFSVKGSVGVAVRVWLSQTSNFQIYWENENGGFAQARSASQSVPGQQWTTVFFDLSAHAEWSGKTVSRLRMDPGTASGVSFAVDYMAMVDQAPIASSSLASQTFDFATDMQGWTTTNQITNYQLQEGKLKGKSNNTNPFISCSSLSLVNQGGVAIEFKTDIGSEFKLYWSTTEGGFTEARSVSATITTLKQFQTLKFDLRNHPQWSGKTITGLRIDPGTITNQNFEIDSVTVLSNEGVNDADGDSLSGLDELVYGTDSAQYNNVPHKLSHERWEGTAAYDVNEIVASQDFYDKPDISRYGDLNTLITGYNVNYFTTRSRGYLTAPESGYYRFWVSGVSGVELHLSTNGSKYTKQRIAQLNPLAGSGYGVNTLSTNQWDMFSSQMSEDIYLEAGQKYYLELIQTTGHVGSVHASIAWARPGQARVTFDLNHVESYAITLDDGDDDFLPDAWESQYGLDVTDNGLVDIAHQGEHGDFDSDGLNNREEYLYGTDPTDPDSDGDGLNDATEIRTYGTSPTVSDAPSGLLTQSVNLTQYTGSASPWTLTSQGLVPTSFRGSISWNFSVPSDGFWLIDAATTLMGDLYLNETVAVEMFIDGVSIGETEIIYGSDRDAMLRVFTPYLTTGNHTFGLKINNMLTRRLVSIRSIDVIQPQGADLNSDGIPDWVVDQLEQFNTLTPYNSTSRTSPAHVEGTARMRASATVNGTTVITGLDRSHWYANLALDQATATPFTVAYEQGFGDEGAITWQSTNVFSSETLTIRKGDSLKLIAQPLTGATGQSVTLTFGPAGWNGTIGAAGTSTVSLSSDLNHHIYTLIAAGTYKVRATRPNGNTALMTIVVKQADFTSTPKDLVANMVSTLSYSTNSVTSSLYFDGGKSAYITNPATVSGTTLSFKVSPKNFGTTNMLARLYENGPVIGKKGLNVVNLSDVIQNNSSFTYTSADYPGYKIIRSPIVVTGLPEGATVVITIFRAGVTFLDGTTTMTLDASDFTNDFYNLEFLFPENMDGGYCHYIDIYDRNGNYIGRR